MKSTEKENYEYDKFMVEFVYKVQEIRRDFDKLSDENKMRFKKDIFRIMGIEGGMAYKFKTN